MPIAEPPGLIHLDANYAIAALRRSSPQSRQLEKWLSRGVLVQMSAVAWSEYLCGPRGALDEARVRTTRRMVGEIEPFTGSDAELAGELFNATGRRSRSHVDCMIAAPAIRREAELATLNLEDFRRFDQLRLAQEL